MIIYKTDPVPNDLHHNQDSETFLQPEIGFQFRAHKILKHKLIVTVMV